MEKRSALKGVRKPLFYFRLKKSLAMFPFLYKPISILIKSLEYFNWRFHVYFRRKKNSFHFDTIYYISPHLIQYCTNREFNPYLCDGMVKDGDWDITPKKFEHLDVYNAFKNRFLEGKEWKDTLFFHRIIEGIVQRGEYQWGCFSESDFLKRCEKLDLLYKKIKIEGYKEQAILNQFYFDISKIDEVSLNFDRFGNLLFNNGAHRLSIAKILNLEKIPVRITVTHKKCNDFSIV